MPPKFQSSFIPKGPLAGSGAASVMPAKMRPKSLTSLIVYLIFGVSLAGALGVLAYRLYLGYSIKNMQSKLETVRESLEPDIINELLRTNDRLSSTEMLLNSHKALSPLFSFLESSTPRSVRFNEFSFTTSQEGLRLVLKGEASGYGALAGAAKIIQDSPNFKDPIFSDLKLDERGNVTFSLKALISSDLLSYERQITALEKLLPPSLPSVSTPATSTGATSSVETLN